MGVLFNRKGNRGQTTLVHKYSRNGWGLEMLLLSGEKKGTEKKGTDLFFQQGAAKKSIATDGPSGHCPLSLLNFQM